MRLPADHVGRARHDRLLHREVVDERGERPSDEHQEAHADKLATVVSPKVVAVRRAQDVDQGADEAEDFDLDQRHDEADRHQRDEIGPDLTAEAQVVTHQRRRRHRVGVLAEGVDAGLEKAEHEAMSNGDRGPEKGATNVERRDQTRKESERTSRNFRNVGPEGGSTEGGRRRAARARCRSPEGAGKEASGMSNQFHTRLLTLAPKKTAPPANAARGRSALLAENARRISLDLRSRRNFPPDVAPRRQFRHAAGHAPPVSPACQSRSDAIGAELRGRPARDALARDALSRDALSRDALPAASPPCHNEAPSSRADRAAPGRARGGQRRLESACRDRANSRPGSHWPSPPSRRDSAGYSRRRSSS